MLYICFSFLIFIFLITFSLKSRGERYFRLDDGRILCFECMESAITDTGECQPLYHAIRDYYEGMNMRIDQQIPMLLVGREALNEAIVGEKNVMNPSILCFSVIGINSIPLTLSNWLVSTRVSITCQKQEGYAFPKNRQLPVYDFQYLLLLFYKIREC